METPIRTQGLTKAYHAKGGKKVVALRGLSLEVNQGEVFGFLGPNGAGKSTTIKLLMGLLRPTTGKFTIGGFDGTSGHGRRLVGYLPENPVFYDYLTAEELMYFIGRTFGMGEQLMRDTTQHLLKVLELTEACKRPIRTYSKGMLQRLGLAQALLHDPDIYVLDEPMSGLDPIGRIMVREMILDMRLRGKTVFMSTHILHDIETICDRVGIIVNGQLKMVDSIRNIMQSGVKGYAVTFNTIGPSFREAINVLADQGIERYGTMSMFVAAKDIERFMAKVARHAGTSVQLVDPVRKGLEELFKEIVHEDRAF